MKGYSPRCPFCGSWSRLVSGRVVHPSRPELHQSWFYRCAPCDALAATVPDTAPPNPIGELTRGALSSMRADVHAAIESMIGRKVRRQGGSTADARASAMRWLGEQLGLDALDIRIDTLDETQCRTVLDALEPFLSPTITRNTEAASHEY